MRWRHWSRLPKHRVGTVLATSCFLGEGDSLPQSMGSQLNDSLAACIMLRRVFLREHSLKFKVTQRQRFSRANKNIQVTCPG